MNSNILKSLSACLLIFSLTSCNDWLTEDTPGRSGVDEFFTTDETINEAVIASYVPLMWEYGNSTTYYPEWFIGDVVSDDALKGGGTINDMADVYDMENFKTNTNNTLLLGFYRAQWQGIARTNLALQQIENLEVGDNFTQAHYNQYKGEAKFLRAMYYFRLARIYGGMPLIDYVVDSSSLWKQTRSSLDETLQFILDDLKEAAELLPTKKAYSAENLGRATSGSADALLMRVALYRAGFQQQAGDNAGATESYKLVKAYGETIQKSGQYELCSNYNDNFTLAGENGKESVFEIQYTEDPTSDYGEGEGFTRGTFTLVLQRSRSSVFGAGWGFDKPTQNLYNEFENGDYRLNSTILNPTDEQMETPAQEIYLGDRYCPYKYGMYTDGPEGSLYYLTHDTRGPINNKYIRYSDVLLMYAEACCELDEISPATEALNKVRARVSMPAFPYTASIQGKTVTFGSNQADLRSAIRHERRVELAMEGHRWFDLCRWGVAKETIDNYYAKETEDARKHYAGFIKGKHEFMPIPAKEVDLSGIAQNKGY